LPIWASSSNASLTRGSKARYVRSLSAATTEIDAMRSGSSVFISASYRSTHSGVTRNGRLSASHVNQFIVWRTADSMRARSATASRFSFSASVRRSCPNLNTSSRRCSRAVMNAPSRPAPAPIAAALRANSASLTGEQCAGPASSTGGPSASIARPPTAPADPLSLSDQQTLPHASTRRDSPMVVRRSCRRRRDTTVCPGPRSGMPPMRPGPGLSGGGHGIRDRAWLIRLPVATRPATGDDTTLRERPDLSREGQRAGHWPTASTRRAAEGPQGGLLPRRSPANGPLSVNGRHQSHSAASTPPLIAVPAAETGTGKPGSGRVPPPRGDSRRCSTAAGPTLTFAVP
jgi:hypothetical protein